MLAQGIVALHKGNILNAMLPNGLFVPFSLWAGYKITIHALVNNPRKLPPSNV